MKHHSLNQQDGFVSIITAVIITIILGVITISFVVIMNREQVQARDRQLSTQAFYAAESGANYVIKADLDDTDTCLSRPALDEGGAISVTCILVTKDPDEIILDSVGTDRPVVFNITDEVNEITVAWQHAERVPPLPSAWPGSLGSPPSFPTASSWGVQVGVVEMIIYPIRNPVKVDDLATDSRTYFFYPTAGPANAPNTVNYAGTDGQVVAGHCNTGSSPHQCLARITGLGSIGAVNGYVIRLRAIYNPVSVQLNGIQPDGETGLSGAQRVIDVTGKASDVLRRIQIRVPQRPSYNLPTFTIETALDLCKTTHSEPRATYDFCAAPGP